MNHRKKQIQKIQDDIPVFPYKYRYDVFSALAVFILDGLKTHRRYNVNSYAPDFKNIEKWHNTIDKMIWSFNQITHEYPDDPHTIFFNKKWKMAEENGIQLMTIDENNTIHFSDILEEERPSDEEQNAYRNKIQEGLDLFAKYFQDLWD